MLLLFAKRLVSTEKEDYSFKSKKNIKLNLMKPSSQHSVVNYRLSANHHSCKHSCDNPALLTGILAYVGWRQTKTPPKHTHAMSGECKYILKPKTAPTPLNNTSDDIVPR